MAGWRGAYRPFSTTGHRPRIPAGPARAAGRGWPRKAGKAGQDHRPAPAPGPARTAGRNTATASGEKTWKTRKWQMRKSDSLPPSPGVRVAPGTAAVKPGAALPAWRRALAGAAA